MGKITGTTDSYLIAVGYSQEYPFPKKTFFWTTTSEAHELKVMKVLDDDYAAHAKTLLNTPSREIRPPPTKLSGRRATSRRLRNKMRTANRFPLRNLERSTSSRITCP